MYKYKITGLMSTPVSVPLNFQSDFFISSGTFDLVEAKYDLNGFDLTIPYSDLPELFPLGGTEYFTDITKNIKESDTVIYLEQGYDLTGITSLWIDTELLSVVSFNTTNKTVTVQRGQNGTFANNYQNIEDIGRLHKLTQHPQTFVGLRVYVYFDSKIIGIGVISDPPVARGGVVKIQCDHILKTLDSAIPKLREPLSLNGVDYLTLPTLLNIFNANTNYNDIFLDKIPPIKDLFRFNINALTQESFPVDKFDTFEDFLKYFYYQTGKIIVWRSDIEKFTFVDISNQTKLEEIPEIYLHDYIKIGETPESAQIMGVSRIKAKDKNGKEYIFNLASYNGKEIELDYQDMGVSVNRIYQVASRLFRQSGILYSSLTIPTHSYYFQDFVVGKIYKILDIDKFQTFQSTSDLAYFVGGDKNNLNFIIIKNQQKGTIAPGVPITTGIKSGNDLEISWAWEYRTPPFEPDISEFLDTDQGSFLGTATRVSDGLRFFEEDYVMELQDEAGNVITGITIKNIDSGGNITLDISGASSTVADETEYWMYYGNLKYPVATEQEDWMYWSEDNL